MKRGGFLPFLVRTISNFLVIEIGWTDVGSGGYILVSWAHINTSLCQVSDTGSTEPLVCNLQIRARTHAVLVMGLYELLSNPTT